MAQKKAFKAYRLLLKDILHDNSLRINKIEPKIYLYRFIHDLDLSMQVYKLSTKFLDVLAQDSNYMVGKDPKGIAAVALYLASRYLEEFRTQVEISEVAMVTEATLRSCAKKIQQSLDKL